MYIFSFYKRQEEREDDGDDDDDDVGRRAQCTFKIQGC